MNMRALLLSMKYNNGGETDSHRSGRAADAIDEHDAVRPRFSEMRAPANTSSVVGTFFDQSMFQIPMTEKKRIIRHSPTYLR